MLAWLSNIWALHWGCFVGALSLIGAGLLMGHEQRLCAKERRRDRRIREEFQAYASLDAALHGEHLRELAKRVCRLITRKSAFQRVAMLVQDAGGQMQVASSIGMDETTIQALHAWGSRIAEENLAENPMPEEAGIRIGEKSFAVVLGKNAADMGCGRAIMIPLQTSTGQIRGALAVCADGLMSLQRKTVEETISPLEALAVKLGWAIESSEIIEQLKQAEKLTGLGSRANGVAQELADPLKVVLGFAEQIAKTSKDARVRSDAKTIVNEARRMQQSVQSLMSFDQPEVRIDESVEIVDIVRKLAAECEEKLESRGVLLVVEADEDIPAVRGNGDALRQVLEHLLNNAAQAIARIGEDGEREREIRVSVSRDTDSVQMIVSDTGPGFKQPGQIFGSVQSGERSTNGLGICHAIVHEHGGEIGAFNLHPYGAAVMVELPLGEIAAQNFPGMVREVA